MISLSDVVILAFLSRINLRLRERALREAFIRDIIARAGDPGYDYPGQLQGRGGLTALLGLGEKAVAKEGPKAESFLR